MNAVKENRVYTITETDVDSFRKEGYDIFDDNGKLIAYGIGKTVAYEKFAETVENLEKLMEENAVLSSENEELKAEIKKLKTPKRTKKTEE